MRQTYDYEDQSGGLPLIYMALAVSAFVLMILVLVVTMNNNKKTSPDYAAAVQEESTTENVETSTYETTGSLVASDLDFWDMYPLEESETKKEEIKKEEQEEEESEEEEMDPSKDGKHVEVVLRDGTSEWLPINPYWKKNTYDFANLVSKNDLLHYYSDGKQISYLGVDLSKYQKSVDFAAIQNEGIDFCILRVGARGYETGVIQEDEKFEEFLTGAEAVGMPVGLYFFSQAVTEEEAIEEANFVIGKIGEHKISYPIAYDMEFIQNDNARIETLTKAEKTNIALAFLNRIEEAGFTGMLYGNKEWLLKRIELHRFENYDVWLAEEKDIPDYPYIYSMWQYTKQGEVYGIDGYVDLNISFIDYSAR
ncbi:MAG: glycoside hydrolase family 25 protein [Lachnospiraceae bacterium]|nr:glycoside hydrolase family 25 protein [Lachnospiraceae bacterium]